MIHFSFSVVSVCIYPSVPACLFQSQHVSSGPTFCLSSSCHFLTWRFSDIQYMHTRRGVRLTPSAFWNRLCSTKNVSFYPWQNRTTHTHSTQLLGSTGRRRLYTGGQCKEQKYLKMLCAISESCTEMGKRTGHRCSTLRVVQVILRAKEYGMCQHDEHTK